MREYIPLFFAADAAIHLVLLLGIVWSVMAPARRIWPPPAERSWLGGLIWLLFYLAFGLNAVLLLLDWNSGPFAGNLRFAVGFPLIVLGTLLLAWGIRTLGVRNTSGRKHAFIASGPYAFTRNPQYLGDIILFAGLSIAANSAYLWAAHMLSIMALAITPLAEESWLEETYGERYVSYKRGTSRFL